MAKDYTVADFIAFCESKGEESYEFTNNKNCAIAQFMKFAGFTNVHVTIGAAFAGLDDALHDTNRIASWNDDIDDLIHGFGPMIGTYSFEGAAEELRKYRNPDEVMFSI